MRRGDVVWLKDEGRRISKGQGLRNKPQSLVLTAELIKHKHAHLLSKMWGVHQKLFFPAKAEE